MERVILNRFNESRHQVLGEIMYSGKILCKTLELPWKNNERGKSCIPFGEYTVIRRTSPKYGEHFHILDVPGRQWILIHQANYVSQLLGCIAVGKAHKDINGDGKKDVTSSKDTMQMLLQTLPKYAFKLEII